MLIQIRRRRREWLSLAAIIGTVAALVGTPAASARPAASDQGAAAALPTFNVNLGAYTARYADIFVAQYEGFFKKAGLDVRLTGMGTQYFTNLLAGRGDVGLAGPTTIFSPARQGKNLKVIYATQFGSAVGFPVAADSPYRTVMDLAGKKVGSFASGQSRGITQALSDYIVSRGGAPLQITVVATVSGDFTPLIAGGVIESGSVAADDVAPYIRAGKVKWLTDARPGSVLVRQLFPDAVVGASFFGYDENLKANRDKVTRFIAGLRLAERWLAKTSDKVVAKVLRNAIEGFDFYDIDDLTSAVTTDRRIWAIKPEGYISKKDWDVNTLPTWSQWGLGYDIIGVPTFSYASRVDMSYWNASTKIVNRILAKQAN